MNVQSRNKREGGEKREVLGNDEEKNTLVGELENKTILLRILVSGGKLTVKKVSKRGSGMILNE